MSDKPHQPYDHNCLTEPERAVQQMQTKQNCWKCEHLKRRRRSGYRGCEEGHDINAVINGEWHCPDWKEK